MNRNAPIDLLFTGMEKLGPGDDAKTCEVLQLLPQHQFELIIDAGCGAGRQTFVLAEELATLVHAVDNYAPFLNVLARLSRERGLAPLIKTHCMDMKDIPSVFTNIDLLWSEGAAYSIGFVNALDIWATAIKPGGYAVVSELSWLREQVPDTAKKFFLAGYPGMLSVSNNVAAAEAAGYRVLTTRTIAKQAWIEDYYDILEPRAKTLVKHPDSSVREFAAETLREIEVFAISADSYGYVFYVLQRT